MPRRHLRGLRRVRTPLSLASTPRQHNTLLTDSRPPLLFTPPLSLALDNRTPHPLSPPSRSLSPLSSLGHVISLVVIHLGLLSRSLPTSVPLRRWRGTAARLVAFRHHGRRLVVERLPSHAPPKGPSRLLGHCCSPRRLPPSRLAPRRRASPLVPPGGSSWTPPPRRRVANSHLVLVVVDWAA